VPADITYPIALRLLGEDRVTVPAGTFDCWRLSVRFGSTEDRVRITRSQTLWVRRSDGLLVRSRDTTHTPGRVEEIVLLAERPSQ
jgi:hypothetical protein